MGFTSCGDDELDVTPAPPINNIEDESTQRDKMFDEYIGDYSNITCRFCQAGESSILFTGLKNKHLWFAEYETATRGIKFEWTDIEETDTIQKVYKGYGEYETIKLDNIFPLFHKKTTAGNIVTLALNGYRQNIFTFNGRTKRNQLQSDPNKNKVAYSWFQESVFIGNCCYSSEGDTVYVAMKQPEFDSHGMPAETELISYEEGIRFLTGYLEDVSAENISISKYNYKDAKSVWVTRIVPPFDVTSDAKRVLTLTGNTTNIWILQGTYTFLNLYNEESSGIWRFLRSLGGFTHMVREIEMDPQGNIWVKHLRKGLFRFRINPDLKRVEDVRTYMELGDVKDGDFSLFKINGRVVFSNGEMFYTYEDMNDSIIPYESMNEQLADLKGIHSVSHAKGNLYWFVNSKMAYLVKCEMNVFRIEHRIPFSLFDGLSIEERAAMVYDNT